MWCSRIQSLVRWMLLLDGAHSIYGAFKVASSVLSVAKVTTLLCDPINGNVNPKNIPGAVVQYAVTITNAAGAASCNPDTE